MANLTASTPPKPNFRWKIDTCQSQVAAMRKGEIELHALTKGHYPGILLKPSQLEGVNSIGFWNGVRAQNWGIAPHRNEGLEISYLETGNMEFVVGAKRYHLHSRQLTLTRPWQMHKLGSPNIGPGKMHWLILDVGGHRPNQDWTWPAWLNLVEADKVLLTRKLKNAANPVWNASPATAAIFGKLADVVLNWKGGQAESRMIVLLNQLLLEILAILSTQQVHEDPEMAARRHRVESFLNGLAVVGGVGEQHWTLEGMAADCGMSVTTFSKYCRELVNSGPVEFLNQCRLERAARQLRDSPEVPIIEIAFQNCFNSSQYFATVFHRHFGMAPRDYRNLSLNNKGTKKRRKAGI